MSRRGPGRPTLSGRHLNIAVGAVLGLCALAVTGVILSGGPDRPAEVDQGPSAEDLADGVVAQVASFDLAAGDPGRFLVGVLTNDYQLVNYGTVELSFRKLDGDRVIDGSVTASWSPLAGQEIDGATPAEPTRTDTTGGAGIYEAEVTFPEPGYWQVEVRATVDGEDVTAIDAFEVADEHQIIVAGEDAPRTRQPLADAPQVPARAIDSRASPDVPVPDRTLHDITIADAIAAGRPTLVVVSTPTYCTSRFCGPITETVEELELRYGDRMSFVHLEVWSDFDTSEVNSAAAEWVMPPGSDGNEPWVFLVDGSGKLAQRWDNVASTTSMEEAIEAVL